MLLCNSIANCISEFFGLVDCRIETGYWVVLHSGIIILGRFLLSIINKKEDNCYYFMNNHHLSAYKFIWIFQATSLNTLSWISADFYSLITLEARTINTKNILKIFKLVL